MGSSQYTPFNLSLPAGVSEESGKTQIRAGESFSLVASNPPENITISLSASIPWVDGSLLVYKPDENAAASDGKGYQNMVGVKIRQTEVLATTNITRAGKNIDVDITKVWADNANQDGLRPTASEYASMVHLMKAEGEVTDVKAQVTDNGDNTYTVRFINLPKYESGTSDEITYWVTEDSIPGYTADKTSVSDGGTLTNTHVPTAPVKTASEGDASSGNASSGNTSSGNTSSGNAISGNTSSGNASSSNTSSGNASSSDSALGNIYGAKTAGNGAGGSAPATGDDSNPLLYASLLAASGATLLILLGKRELRKRELRKRGRR